MVRIALAGLVAVVGWIFVQWAPQAPASWHHPVWQGIDAVGRVTMAPDATLSFGLVLAAAVVLFILLRFVPPRIGQALLYGLAGLAVIPALAAMVHGLGGPLVAYLVFPIDDLTFLAMAALVICLGRVLEPLPSFMLGLARVRSKLWRFFRSIPLDQPLVTINAIVMLVLLWMLGDGLASLAFSLGVLLVIHSFVASKIIRGGGVVLLISAVMIIAVIAVFTLGQGGNPSGGASTLVLNLIEVAPLLGYGAGSLDEVMAAYGTGESAASLPLVLRHVVELGIPATVVLYLSMALLLLRLWLQSDMASAISFPAVALVLFWLASGIISPSPMVIVGLAVLLGLGLPARRAQAGN